jgi:hypothetical protein
MFARVVALTRACLALLCVLFRVVRALFRTVSRVVTRHLRASFARVALVVVVMFVRLVRALSVCCLARVARVVRTRCHTSFACVACAIYACRSPCRALLARISRVDHVFRATSVPDNKLFSLINIHVNNLNSSGHIF